MTLPGAGRLAALLAAALLAAACATAPGTAAPGATAPTSTSAAAGTAPVAVHDPGQVTQETGQPHGPCHVRVTPAGDLPDPACTPGAFDPAVTAAILCDPAYSTRSYRPPASQTTRFKYGVVAPAYGLDHDRGELDHLINLDLGGANDGANLWLETGPIPNPKDAVEGRLHRWMCDGATAGVREERLRAAQVEIARNWTAAVAVLGAGG